MDKTTEIILKHVDNKDLIEKLEKDGFEVNKKSPAKQTGLLSNKTNK